MNITAEPANKYLDFCLNKYEWKACKQDVTKLTSYHQLLDSLESNKLDNLDFKKVINTIDYGYRQFEKKVTRPLTKLIIKIRSICDKKYKVDYNLKFIEKKYTELKIKLILEYGVDLAAILARPAASDISLFLRAVERNRQDIVKLILKISEHLNPAANHNAALQLAFEKGHLEMVKLLSNDSRIDPAREGQLNIIKLFETHNYLNYQIYNKIFKSAVEYGHSEIVRLLLNSQRFNPQAHGNQAMGIAAEKGYVEIVKLLINKSIDPSAGDNAAIKSAAKNGHLEVLKLLLEDTRVDPSAGDNAAIKAAAKYGHLETFSLLSKNEQVIKWCTTKESFS